MKTILLINVFGGIGGAGQSFLHIVDSIDTEKLRPVVYSPATPPVMADLLRKRGIEVITSLKPLPLYVHYSGASVTRLNLLFYVRSLTILLRGIPELKRIIRKVRPDIVMVNSMTHAWVGPLLPKDIVRVCFVRETYLDTPLNLRTNLIKRWLVRSFDKVVFISDYDMRRTPGLREGQGVVIKDSVRVDGAPYDALASREKLGLRPSGKYILFMGGFDRIKGGEVLMKALALIGDPDVKVLFLPVNPSGTSAILKIKTLLGLNFEKRIRDLISRHHLEDRVIMFPSQANMDDFYKAADAVVFPSKYPHQARPAFESGAMRKPVVMSRYEATFENVRDGYNGLYFKPGDAGDFARCIVKVLTDDALRATLGENNYQETKANHDLKDFKRQIGALMSGLFEKSEKTRRDDTGGV